MFERFTDRARKVMRLANQEAQRFNHDTVNTAHVLIGLVKEGYGVAANVLKNLGVDLCKVSVEAERIIMPSDPATTVMVPQDRLPLSPHIKTMLSHAVEEARRLGHNYCGTEHLLLGILRDEQDIACQVLVNLGIKLTAVRQEIMDLLGQPLPPLPPQTLPEGGQEFEVEGVTMSQVMYGEYTLQQISSGHWGMFQASINWQNATRLEPTEDRAATLLSETQLVLHRRGKQPALTLLTDVRKLLESGEGR